MNPLLTMSPYKEYFSYLNTRKAHATPTTVEGYASDYRKFHELMGVYLHEAQEADLLKYFELRGASVSGSTLARNKGGIKPFMDWLDATHRRPDNPGKVLKLIAPSKNETKPHALKLDQIEVLLSHLKWDSLHEFQISLWITGAMETGLRKMEMNRLKWDDIDLKKETMKSLRKGHKHWSGPLPGGFKENLLKYKKLLESSGIESPWVFFNLKGDHQAHIQRSTPWMWSQELKKRCGWGDEIQFHPHTCRHILCTKLAKSGMPDRIAILLTGHASSAVYNKVYVRTEDEEAAQWSKKVLG
jgi:integrase